MHRKTFIAFCQPFLLFLFTQSCLAQLSVRTLSLARYGQLPRSDNENNPAYYSDLLLEYRYDRLLVGIRGEGFDAPNTELPFGGDTRYSHLSQRYAEFNWSWGLARAGNLYGIFGKGVILRAFELPGFVYESRVFRKQHRIIRDIDGLKLKMSPGSLSITVLGGALIDPLIAPDENRDLGDLIGGQMSLALPSAISVGYGYLKHETQTITSTLSTYFLSWSAAGLLEKIGAQDLTFDLYSEYALDKGFGQLAAFNKNTAHAFYLAADFSWKTLGGSFEYKDYQKFDFGINDPPPLIRENTETLLNRSTHVLDANSERGWQVEFFYSPFSLNRVIFNYSRSIDDRQEDFQPVFIEKYVGFEHFGDAWTWRFFLDVGQDELLSEISRVTTGIFSDYTLSGGTAVALDLQWQQIHRSSPPAFDHRVKNLYTSLTVQNLHNMSLSISAERSTDPDVTDSAKYFINGSVGWRPTPQIYFQLFAGKRRGGSACDHGFCIEVLDFEGAEFRLETRW